jgi:hypothetical protein
MSWSRRSLVFLAAAALLGGCTLTPVFRGNSDTPQARIAYAEPTTRSEQVIYQALRSALGEGGDLILTVDTDATTRDVSAVASADPATPVTLDLTAHYTLTTRLDLERLLIDETRNASATFTRGPQQIANDAAQQDALERAARQLAEMIRARLLIYLETGQ